MDPFARIVLPVDGSQTSSRALAYVVQLAKDENATVEMCSVIDDASVMLPMAEGALIDPLPLLAEHEDRMHGFMNTAVTQLRAARVSANATVLHGRPFVEIDAFARHARADAIVIGTNGRGGLGRAFLGSVTTALLRVADVPVITVHSDDETRTGPLLVAIDASPASAAVLDCAIARARVANVRLLLLHVFDEDRIEAVSTKIGLRTRSARRQALTDAETALDDVAERVRGAGIPFTTAIERGAAAAAILGAAQNQNVSAIAIGTHGRGALERFLIGSVADDVVRGANVPVLVVRRPTAKPARTPRPSFEQVNVRVHASLTQKR